MFLVEKINRISREVVEWEMTRDYSKAVEMQKSWTTESTWSSIDNMSQNVRGLGQNQNIKKGKPMEIVNCASHGEQVKWGSECRICFEIDIARWGSN